MDNKVKIVCLNFIELAFLASPGRAVNQITHKLPGGSNEERVALTQELITQVGMSIGSACLIGGILYRYFGQRIRYLAHLLRAEVFLSLFIYVF